MRWLITLAVTLIAPLLWADEHASVPQLEVSRAWVRATLPGQTVASAFAVLKNPFDQPLKMTEIHSTAAASVELHSHSMVNGQMQMRRIENFTIPAKGEAVFQPGGQHIMLMGLVKPLREGDSVDVEMCFDNICSKLQLPVVTILNEARHE